MAGLRPVNRLLIKLSRVAAPRAAFLQCQTEAARQQGGLPAVHHVGVGTHPGGFLFFLFSLIIQRKGDGESRIEIAIGGMGLSGISGYCFL